MAVVGLTVADRKICIIAPPYAAQNVLLVTHLLHFNLLRRISPRVWGKHVSRGLCNLKEFPLSIHTTLVKSTVDGTKDRNVWAQHSVVWEQGFHRSACADTGQNILMWKGILLYLSTTEPSPLWRYSTLPALVCYLHSTLPRLNSTSSARNHCLSVRPPATVRPPAETQRHTCHLQTS